MPKDAEEPETSTMSRLSNQVPNSIKGLVPKSIRSRAGHGHVDPPGHSVRFEELQALMNDRYHVSNLKTVDRHQFKESIEAFHKLEDASMEGYISSDVQRIKSVKFYWPYDHDFGDFKVGPGTGKYRPAWLIARFMENFGTPEMDLSGKTVLDIGCYLGGTSLLLAAMGAKVVAIEEVTKYVDCLKYIRNAFAIENLEVRNVSLYDLSGDEFQDAFDVVLFAGVLYHLSDPILGTRLTFNVLKPGGTCLLETGATRSEERILEYGGKNQTNKGGGANWFFPSPLVVTEIMDEVGYTDIRSAVNHRANKRRDRMVAVGTKTKQVDMLRAGLSVPTVR